MGRKAGICFHQTGSVPFLPSFPPLHPFPARTAGPQPSVPLFPRLFGNHRSSSLLPATVGFSRPHSPGPHKVTVTLTRRQGTQSHRAHSERLGRRRGGHEGGFGGSGSAAGVPRERGMQGQTLLFARDSPPAAQRSRIPRPGRGLCSHRARLGGHSPGGHGLARVPAAAGRSQPRTRADAAQLEGTTDVLQPRSTLQRDLLSSLERAEEPRRRVPRSSPTRIISSYFQGKACHLLCVFNPSLQSQGTPALLGAHCSLSPRPPMPQHSLQKGREEKRGF